MNLHIVGASNSRVPCEFPLAVTILLFTVSTVSRYSMSSKLLQGSIHLFSSNHVHASKTLYQRTTNFSQDGPATPSSLAT